VFVGCGDHLRFGSSSARAARKDKGKAKAHGNDRDKEKDRDVKKRCSSPEDEMFPGSTYSRMGAAELVPLPGKTPAYTLTIYYMLSCVDVCVCLTLI
jgi:hypothetical protein